MNLKPLFFLVLNVVICPQHCYLCYFITQTEISPQFREKNKNKGVEFYVFALALCELFHSAERRWRSIGDVRVPFLR